MSWMTRQPCHESLPGCRWGLFVIIPSMQEDHTGKHLGRRSGRAIADDDRIAPGMPYLCHQTMVRAGRTGQEFCPAWYWEAQERTDSVLRERPWPKTGFQIQ